MEDSIGFIIIINATNLGKSCIANNGAYISIQLSLAKTCIIDTLSQF